MALLTLQSFRKRLLKEETEARTKQAVPNNGIPNADFRGSAEEAWRKERARRSSL